MSKEVNKYLIIPNDDKINEYNSNSFIFPLENFSVGFDKYFSVSEINKYSSIYEISVMINKFLHKEEIELIKNIIGELKNVKYFFIEDLGLINILPSEKIVIYPSHIISNYESVNFFNTLGYKNILISNELTIDELSEISKNTKSNLFYMYVNLNNIMYSKRQLLSNYYDFYNINSIDKKIELIESVSKHKLLFYEENQSTTVFNNKIFCASKYLNELKGFNLIINFCHINNNIKKIILNNLNNKELYNLIDCDYKFLEESIVYKVGDIND